MNMQTDEVPIDPDDPELADSVGEYGVGFPDKEARGYDVGSTLRRYECENR